MQCIEMCVVNFLKLSYELLTKNKIILQISLAFLEKYERKNLETTYSNVGNNYITCFDLQPKGVYGIIPNSPGG